MTSMRTVHFSRPPHLPCPAMSKILPPPWPWTSDFKQTLSPYPLQMITNQLKENIIQGWLLYVIRSLLQISFCFQYQLINLVRLSIDFFPFSWSQPGPQSCFEKSKTFFSPSSSNKKISWGQSWAEALLSAFLWLYILVCLVV